MVTIFHLISGQLCILDRYELLKFNFILFVRLCIFVIRVHALLTNFIIF